MLMDYTKLIQAVHVRRPLWDRLDPSYHNKEVKGKLWQQVSREMGGDAKGPLEMKQKWSNLRDVFRREWKKTRGSKPLKKSRWAYYKRMRFLEPSNIMFEKEKEDGTRLGIEENLSSLIHGVSVKLEQNGESSWVELDSDSDPYPDVDNAYASLDEKREVVDQQKIEEDEDYHFAMSLVSPMRNVPSDKKLQMRIAILKVLCDLNNSLDECG